MEGSGLKCLMYEDWTKKRIEAIKNNFPKDWFNRKNIIEMGACHGDIGIEFMKLGANVTFCDSRLEHMRDIPSKIGFDPEMYIINNNKPYTLQRKYDLVLHMSLLCHIENWKEDLKRVTDLSDQVVLETIVNPDQNAIDLILPSDEHHYADYNSGRAYVTEQSILKYLREELSCAVVEIKVENTNYNWIDRWFMVRHLYDWDYNNIEPIQQREQSGITLLTHYRRMWVITKVNK